MIPIYICDDDLQLLENLKKTILNTVLINGYDMQLETATDEPEKLLEARKSQAVRSIYFLDIDLKNERYNGFTLAKEIRKMDTRGFIVFVTTHAELMPETFKYQVEAINYIIKDNVELLNEQVARSLEEIDHLVGIEQQDAGSYYTVNAVGTTYQIPMKDILFFETCAPHRLTLYSKSQNIEFRGDLSQIEKELNRNYLRIHQSYLVNKDAVNEVDKKNSVLRLKDGSELPISRRGKKTLL